MPTGVRLTRTERMSGKGVLSRFQIAGMTLPPLTGI